jgi:hypothetical protein
LFSTNIFNRALSQIFPNEKDIEYGYILKVQDIKKITRARFLEFCEECMVEI